jgi:chemotaxis protein methyltransferase CheR
MALHPEDFRFICDFVREAAAIVLEPGKEYLVETRLSPVASQNGVGDIAGIVRELRKNRHAPLAQKVIDAMTTNETSFFRDLAPYQHLRQKVIPALMEARKNERTLNIWCGAASSGQEPYSMLMMMREEFPQLASWNVRFVATDISKVMLARCREGVYSQLEVNRGLPAPLLVKYFSKRGIDWQIDESLRKAVEWREFNLAGRAWIGLPSCDLVMLRNVMIYFDVPTKRAILGNIRRVLKPDGYLFLGTAETTINVDDRFQSEQVQSSCYRLKAA